MIKKNIYIMYAIGLLQGMVFYAPIATLYRQAAGVTVFQIALIEGISLALCVLLELPWGIAADRLGYKNTMLICCGLYFASKLVFWQADGFAMFLLERVMLSVVIAGLSGVDMSILYLSCGEVRSRRTFGVYESLGTLGLMAAAIVFTTVVKDDYRLARLLTVISYGLAAVCALGLKEVRAPEKRKKGQGAELLKTMRSALRNKRLIMLLAAAALLSEANQTITVFLGQLQYIRCGMDSAQTGAAYLIINAAGLLGGLSARATERVGEKWLGKALFIAAALSCAVLCITKSAVLSICMLILLRFSSSLFTPMQMSLQNRCIQSKDRATLLSANAVMMDGVAITTNLGFGFAADRSLPASLALGFAICLAGFILFTMWCRGDISAQPGYISDSTD